VQARFLRDAGESGMIRVEDRILTEIERSPPLLILEMACAKSNDRLDRRTGNE
jgi:hypothetical protein